MDLKEGLLVRLRDINERVCEFRTNYYELEAKLDEVLQETEHLIEDIEDFDLSERISDTAANRTVKETKVTLEQCRKLIGKKIRILNPNAGERPIRDTSNP